MIYNFNEFIEILEGKEEENTYETFSMLGVFLNDNIAKKIEKFILLNKKSFSNNEIESNKEDFSEIINFFIKNINQKNYNFKTEYLNSIQNKLKNVLDIIINNKFDKNAVLLIQKVQVMFSQTLGMYNFIKDILISKMSFKNQIYFISDSIDNYYKIEKEKLGELKGAKDNTADAILIDGLDHESFLKFFQDPNSIISYNEKEGFNILKINDKEIKFVQTSLKMSEHGAQLGKIGNFLVSLGFIENDKEKVINNIVSDVNDSISYETKQYNNLTEYQIFLLEKFDIFDKIKNSAKKVFDNIIGLISKTLLNFKNKLKSLFLKKEITDKEKFEILEMMGLPKKEIKELQESIEFNDSYNLNENEDKDFSPKDKVLLSLIYKNSDIIIKNLNKNIEELLKTCQEKNIKFFAIKSNNIKFPEPKSVINNVLDINNFNKKNKNDSEFAQYVFKIFANYQSISTIFKIIDDINKVSENIAKIVTEMSFGGTKLPLWKVYGVSPTNKHGYIYLGVRSNVEKDKSEKNIIDPFVYKITPVNTGDGYYVISYYMLDEINESEKKYIQFRTGTNTLSRISFIVEGMQTIELNLNEDIIDVIKKSKD